MLLCQSKLLEMFPPFCLQYGTPDYYRVSLGRRNWDVWKIRPPLMAPEEVLKGAVFCNFLKKSCDSSLGWMEMVNLRNHGQFEEPEEKLLSVQCSGKVNDVDGVAMLDQVTKGQILVNKVLKEGEIIHVNQCRAVRTLTWCCFLIRLHLESIKAIVLT